MPPSSHRRPAWRFVSYLQLTGRTQSGPQGKYGTAFEKLMANYFRNDPTLSEEYEDVGRFIDWKYYDGQSDTGIDLVARRREDGRWVAIQCKFYEPTAYLQKSHLDSFFEKSGRSFDTEIVGGGPIGMESATMFTQFGTQVTILDRGAKFGSAFDEDVAAQVQADLEAKGITIINGADVTELKDTDDGIKVRYSEDGGEHTIDATNVPFAIGRTPATEGLGLESAGIDTTERGAIAVDEHLRTNVEGVYAAGDVTGGPQFTYISYDDHRVITSDRWGDGSRVTTGRLYPTTTFINPPVSTIGMGEQEAKGNAASRGHTTEVRFKKIADIPIMPRPKIVGTPEGVAKFIIDVEDDQILGATLYCVDSQELINLVAVAMRQKIPASALGDGIYTHPSSTEVFNALLS